MHLIATAAGAHPVFLGDVATSAAQAIQSVRENAVPPDHASVPPLRLQGDEPPPSGQGDASRAESNVVRP